MVSKKKTAALLILDGYGLSSLPDGDATKEANTPTIDGLRQKSPMAKLSASGQDVGLMDGQMGDSNVGHLNIGAGRIVYQNVARISKSVQDGDFFDNEAFLTAIDNAKTCGSKLHMMGLVSPGGVHSHTDHLYALLRLAKERQVEQVYVHAFLDGRDVPPSSALGYVEELEQVMEEIGVGRIATVSGRYYAMDRDKRWERLEKAYQALVHGQGRTAAFGSEAVKQAYAAGETDEFVLPTVIPDQGRPATIADKDSVIFFNFRADRARELCWALINEEFPGFARSQGALDICLVGMAEYDATLPIPIAFPPQDLKNTLGQYLSNLGMTQFRTAETEKYAHVTFFFNGGVEEAFPGEDRQLIASPKVATYDMQPEMSALEVANAAVAALEQDYDLMVVNFANCDMVGHTGDMQAAIKAVEAVDAALAVVLEALVAKGSSALITADHGNAEQMIDPDTGERHTAHTSNLVPLWLVGIDDAQLKDGILADLAPSLLDMLGLEKPDEMTGSSLLIKEEHR